MSVVELQPDELEALQAEAGPEPVAKVSVDGPVRTQGLPRKAGATLTKTVTTTPVQVLWADHRRAGALLVSIGQDMLIALSPASKEDPSRMARWPANVPYPCTADTPVWVASNTGTTSISVITEFWAVGGEYVS